MIYPENTPFYIPPTSYLERNIIKEIDPSSSFNSPNPNANITSMSRNFEQKFSSKENSWEYSAK